MLMKLSGPEGLQMLGNDLPLHLARAFADLMDLDVAPEARDRVLVHKSIAAVNLHSLIRAAFGRLG